MKKNAPLWEKQNLYSASSSLWQKLLELVFPAFCLGCKKEGQFLCDDCSKKITLQKMQICPFCRQKNRMGTLCGACQKTHFFLDGVMTAVSYCKEPLLQKCIYNLKYNFVEELAAPLGKILLQTFIDTGLEIEVNTSYLCAVPLHRKRLQFRGFNQSELLAQHFSQCYQKASGKKIHYVDLLQRLHFHTPQMELQRAERLKNTSGVFSVREETAHLIKEKTIFLIDDVATTLATLNNCAQVLKTAGAKKVFGLALARGLGKDD